MASSTRAAAVVSQSLGRLLEGNPVMSVLFEPSDPPVYAPTYVSRGLFDLLSEGEGAVVEADACNVYVTTRNGVTYYTPRLVVS